MPTIATLFSGGELVGVGARAAGLSHLWGCEIDPAIAEVARANGFESIVADVLDIDPSTLAIPDVLHASPVCTRASVANNNAGEAPLDIAMGEKIAQFIDVMKPRIFTLENVFPYRKFKAFQIVLDALSRNGYMWDYDNLNAADFGVPQTRRRLVLRAIRGGLLPNLPNKVPWVGWYQAIEDLIPTLPASRFAKWQLDRLPEELKTVLIGGANRSKSFLEFAKKNRKTIPGQFESEEPSPSIVSTASSDLRAFIVDQLNGGHETPTIRDEDDPGFSLTVYSTKHPPPRAFIVPGRNSSSFSVRNDDEPARVVGDTERVGNLPRAFLVGDQYGQPQDTPDRKLQISDPADPAPSVRAYGKGGTPPRAFLVEGSVGGERPPRVMGEEEPAMTITTPTGGRVHRAWLSQGRVVSMTPRALARFQSVPDSYILPEKASLAVKVIGNGVACLMYQRIMEGFFP